MITRIVQLEFREDSIGQFLEFFEGVKEIVNGFPGCRGMRLYQDIDRPYIVLTYSHWENAEALGNYRNSDAFGKIWPTIKPWFGGKPKAWSVTPHFDGFAER